MNMDIELNRKLWQAAQDVGYPLRISHDGKRLAIHPVDSSVLRHISVLQDLLNKLQSDLKIEIVDWPGTYHTHLTISG